MNIIDPANGSLISKNSTIRWWAGRPKNRGGRGAKLALMHEIGHEFQWLKQEQYIRIMNLFVYKYGTKKLTSFNYKKKFFDKIEGWVVREVETPVAKQINEYLKQRLNGNHITEKQYNDLLEPTRTKYATMNIFGSKASIKTVSPKLDKKLLVPEPKGKARSNAVVDRPVSPIKKTKKSKCIFP